MFPSHCKLSIALHTLFFCINTLPYGRWQPYIWLPPYLCIIHALKILLLDFRLGPTQRNSACFLFKK